MQFTLQAPMTIEQVLRDYFHAGKKLVHELRMAKAITINDEVPRWNITFPIGTILQIAMPNINSNYTAVACAIPIIYEDDAVLVAVKPHNMPTHPNEPAQQNTCMNHIAGHVQGYVEHVQRLDAGTSGVLLMAKNPLVKAKLDYDLATQQVTRIYEAVIEGQLKPAEGTINQAIGRDRHHNTRRVVSRTGQSAITHYKTLQHGKRSVIELNLVTGRTHQIRVHLAFLGHPIIGDVLYGSTVQQDHYELRAKTVRFHHPITQKLTTITNHL